MSSSSELVKKIDPEGWMGYLPDHCTSAAAKADRMRGAEERQAWEECQKRRESPLYEGITNMKGHAKTLVSLGQGRIY